MSIDVSELWDFNHPELSEERFRAALSGASSDDALILQTQIARTYGLRRNFARAREVLADIETPVQNAGAEAKAYYFLEVGRTYASATHPADSQTAETRQLARAAFLQALAFAQAGKRDDLAIDAVHMLTFVDTAAQEQLEWNRKAMALLQASDQPAAKKWEGSLRNNTGYALHELGRFDEALTESKLALEINERGGNPHKIRIAHWMVAWTLRAMGRLDEALAIQLRLEKEGEAAGEPDLYVFEELELLYRALQANEKADYYAARRNTND